VSEERAVVMDASSRAPNVRVRPGRDDSCEYCGEPAKRYVYFGDFGYSNATDWVCFCDDCARLLRDCITKALRGK
jgi:hypothetical protein